MSPGYLTTLKKGASSVAFVDEACSDIGGFSYQIDDTTKRVWSPSAAITATVGGNAASGFSIDYLFGIITFSEEQTGAVEITGSYIPVSAVAGAMSYNISIAGDTPTNTAYGGTGNHTRCYGLHEVTLNFGRYDDLSKTFIDHLTGREKVLVEVNPSGGSEIFRGWFILESSNHSGDQSSIESEEISLQLSGNANTHFSWR